VTHCRKVLGGKEERVGELVFVGEDDARQGEVGMEGTGLRF